MAIEFVRGIERAFDMDTFSVAVIAHETDLVEDMFRDCVHGCVHLS